MLWRRFPPADNLHHRGTRRGRKWCCSFPSNRYSPSQEKRKKVLSFPACVIFFFLSFCICLFMYLSFFLFITIYLFFLFICIYLSTIFFFIYLAMYLSLFLYFSLSFFLTFLIMSPLPLTVFVL